MMRIGILGGTFDPAHHGHLALADAAKKELKLGRLILVPAKISPLKRTRPLFSATERLSELKRLIKGRKNFEVSGLELERRGPSYTVETVRSFRQRFPKDEIFLVMGGDALGSFTLWKNWEEILALCRLAVAERPGVGHKNLPQIARRTVFLKSAMPGISSTQVRAVLDHLKKELPPKNLRHTFAVAQTAEDLAVRHGLDPASARLAGLLHDLSRHWKNEELVRYARANKIKAPYLKFALECQPVLLHGAVASDMARKKFGIRDEEICSAVSKHTLADVSMSAMEKLLFVADLVSKDRRFPEAGHLRAAAFKNLDQAFAEGLRFKMDYVVKARQPIFPGSADVWNRFAAEKL